MQRIPGVMLFGVAISIASTASATASYNLADFGGAFSYAQYNGGTSFTEFATPCSFGTSCLAGPEGAGNSQLAYKAGDLLVAHPGVDEKLTAVLFTAPQTSAYRFDGSAFLADTRQAAVIGNGVTLSEYLNGQVSPSVLLDGPGNTLSISGFEFNLRAGEQIGLLIGNNGNNMYDSVGLRGTISAVPESATWAMMIGGIGVAGGAMRRRRNVTTTLRFA